MISRCHRLAKICVPAAPPKQRGPKRGAASRSARLEEKLDDLFALLGARQPDPNHNGGHISENDGMELEDGADSPSTNLLSTPSTGEDDPGDPSIVEAEDSLQRFREEMIVSAPFVHLPSGLTSVQVRQMYPFLWLNIMGVASRSTKRRKSLSFQARRMMIERVVAGGERSLDLLFGMLTFVNWVHLFPMDKQFASLVSQLVVALVYDLGLQMPPPERPSMFLPFQAAKLAHYSVGKERTIEEKRVVLGAFVITSMSVVSQTFKVADGLRWSPYLDEYLAHISDQSTVPHDRLLVKQVKMQLIVNQVRYSSWKISNKEIPIAWVNILQLQLDDIISNMSEIQSTPGNKAAVFGFYHYTTLLIPAALEAVDLLQTLDRIIYTFDQVKAVSVTQDAGGEDDHAISLGIKKFQGLREAWQNDLELQGKAQSAVEPPETINVTPVHFDTEPIDLYSFHMLPNTLDSIPWQ
ncbi:MAG: hypothetical protein Q9227_001065 [Pyrenula ochraceoflavens]